MTNGNPFNLEYRIIRPDGSLRYLESRAEVAYDTQGKTIRLYGAILDITERKQAEIALKQSKIATVPLSKIRLNSLPDI
ncbi:MAG: PAS domain-containing protein [Nostoc sp.]